MAGSPATASAFILYRRLKELGADVKTDFHSFTSDHARDYINELCCDWAVCWPVNNKPLRFDQYFEAVYGERLDGQPVVAPKVRKGK